MPGGPANRAGIGYENLWIVLRVAEMLAGKVSNLRLEPLGRAGAGIELTVVVEGVSWGGADLGSSLRPRAVSAVRSRYGTGP